MKVKVVTAFNDSQNGFITRPVNEVFECSEERAKDLIELGYVKEAVEEVPAEEKPKPKRKLTKHI
jgi:hypothetical protein